MTARYVGRALVRPRGIYRTLIFFGHHGRMRRIVLSFVLLCDLLRPSVAAEPGTACAEAAVVAERQWALPPDLIHAIGRVESGRYDPATRRVAPWPWTVNANGSGYSFATRTEAVAFVHNLQAHGVRLIDVGCFQVDLFYHPAAFSSLEQAFDPAANADYAGRFLSSLRERTGSWSAAIAGYHSSRSEEGANYRQKVLNQWSAVDVPVAPAGPAETVARAQHQDRYVVLMSDAARAIHVIGPAQ